MNSVQPFKGLHKKNRENRGETSSFLYSSFIIANNPNHNIMRRRIRNSHFENMTRGEQVTYVIEHWENDIWTPVNAEIENGMSVDSCEYRDYYFIPRILEEVKGAEYEKYIPEICHGYLAFEFGF